MTTSSSPAQAHCAIRLYSHSRELVFSGLALFLLVLVSCSLARAQGGVPLITVATDESVSASLSNQFGVPAGQAIDQTGDLVFVGRGGTALFLRPAGAGASIRLLQVGDAAPGIAGSHIVSIGSSVSINSATKILFSVVYTLPDALPHQALLTYDGSAYQKIVSSDDIAPGTTLAYGATLTPLSQGALNDNGDVAFTATPTATMLPTLYIVPAGGAALRIVASEDFLPLSTTVIFATVSPASGINALGQVLISVSTSAAIGSGYYVASEANGGQVIKVALSSDPFCGGGTGFPSRITFSAAALSDTGLYALAAQQSAQAAVCVGVVGGRRPVLGSWVRHRSAIGNRGNAGSSSRNFAVGIRRLG
jgi:hypothetical protein